MKKIFVLFAALAAAMPFAGAADNGQIQIVKPEQQHNSMNLRIDRETTALLKKLEESRKNLQDELEKASASRNITVEGASPMAQERFQTEQDSICMDIRSKITDIQLQIDEIRN